MGDDEYEVENDKELEKNKTVVVNTSDEYKKVIDHCILIMKELIPRAKFGILYDYIKFDTIIQTDPQKNITVTGIIKTTKGTKMCNVFTFSMSRLPGCCGVGVSHNTFVYYEFRKLGIGTALHRVKDEIAQNLMLVSMLLATVVNTNTTELKQLKKNEWKELKEFNNKLKTKHDVVLLCKIY